MEIKSPRKRELSQLAEFIAMDYFPEGVVDPATIADCSDVSYNYGNYRDYFDGVLEYEDGRFHIYLNTHGAFEPSIPRMRFTFAHELGHYFIDEHRNALKKGKSLHTSFYKLQRKNIVELEADFFASCLLMPEVRFKELATSKKFDFSLVELLKNSFQTSISATLFRMIELDTYPFMVVVSEANRIKYHWRTEDFPYKYFVEHGTGKLPVLTAAGDFFNHGEEYADTEEVEVSGWFNSYKDDYRGITLYEKYIYQTSLGRVISILWQ